MYACSKFDKQKMLVWEQQPLATKQDYTLEKAYFGNIVEATDTYKQNAGSKPQRYDLENQLADLGDKIKG